jgi:hypothetical protein
MTRIEELEQLVAETATSTNAAGTLQHYRFKKELQDLQVETHTDGKELISEDFSFNIAGKRVAVYLTAIPDYDNGNYDLTWGEPKSAKSYTVMTQIDGKDTGFTEYLTLHAARHSFMVAVNDLINTIDK